jgi:two-component system, cell cycle sensor histidine kinase and response regulator CckA
MDGPKQYRHYARICVILIVSGGFLWVSLYAKAWTEHNVFPILFPAVALSAWIGGRLGGLLSTFCLALGTAYFHLPPEGLAIDDPADAIRFGTFTFSGAVVAWLSGALKESQTIMMATLRSIGDAVIATDRHGSVRFLNPLAEMLTGWSQKDAKGRPLGEVFRSAHLETGVGVQIPAPNAMCGAISLPENIYLVSKSGSHIPIEDSFAPVLVESGRILGSILVFRDATRRKQNEATLMESERQRLQAQRMEAIGRLAGGVAHDFNNVLMIIFGYATQLLSDPALPEADRVFCEQVLEATKRATALTRQLLAFSRKHPIRPQGVDLNTIVKEMAKMLQPLLSARIQMVVSCRDQDLVVFADPSQIELMIMNLVLNARDAMPEGGILSLATTAETLSVDPVLPNTPREFVVLEISDTGVGMPAEIKQRIFEPFFSTKGPGKGTGLGLSMVYGIVEQANGHVSVESEPNHGTTFRIYLPLAAMEATVEEPHAPEKAPSPGTETLLLVEDETGIRAMTRTYLEGLGYTVLEAETGDAALRIFEERPKEISLVVTDIIMPGIKGDEMVRKIRETRPDMAAIFISGYADAGQLDDNTVILEKPFSFPELGRSIKEALTHVGRFAGPAENHRVAS